MDVRDRREQDAESFAWFFHAEYPALVRALAHVVGRSDAEDLAQEAFVRLHPRWERISRYDRPDAWVRRVGLNLAITHARRQQRRGDRELRAVRDLPQQYDAPAPPSAVRGAVASLAPRDRALVVLFYYEDRPLAEVAEILEMSPGAAKVALHRARTRLGGLLEEEVRDESR